MKRSNHLWLLAALLLLSISCMALPSAAVTPQAIVGDDNIATAVAATLQAGSAQTATALESNQQTATAMSPTVTPTTIREAVQAANTPAAAPPAAPTTNLEAQLAVAYIGSDNNVWIWRAGTAQQLTTTGDVADVSLADDREWIAFSRTTDYLHYSLWAIRSNWALFQPLMDLDAFASLPRDPGAVTSAPVMFDWVPGTHTLAFNTRPAFEGPGLPLNDDLWLANADTGERKQLLPAGQGGKFYYSPDGKQIALVKSTSISLINADGSNRRSDVLTYPVISTYSEYLYYPSPVWLPDQTGLRVVIPPEASMEHPEDDSIVWEVPAAGGAARQIGRFNTPPLNYPQLAPDGASVAYIKRVGDPAENRNELHIASADGSEDTIYATEVSLQSVAWGMDGQRFLYSVSTTDTNARIYLGTPGQAPQVLGEMAGVMELRWLDLSHFIFATRSGGNVGIQLGRIDGTITQLITFPSEQGHVLLFDAK